MNFSDLDTVRQRLRMALYLLEVQDACRQVEEGLITHYELVTWVMGNPPPSGISEENTGAAERTVRYIIKDITKGSNVNSVPQDQKQEAQVDQGAAGATSGVSGNEGQVGNSAQDVNEVSKFLLEFDENCSCKDCRTTHWREE